MKKLTYILLTTVTILIFPSTIYAQSEKAHDKLMYDTLITVLNPSIEKEIIHYYGYIKQYGLYDTKIRRIIREHEGSFSFLTEVQVTTFEHAHDPPYGIETMIVEVSPNGMKTISFQHVGDKVEKCIL